MVGGIFATIVIAFVVFGFSDARLPRPPRSR
jgi:hypothetical protein